MYEERDALLLAEDEMKKKKAHELKISEDYYDTTNKKYQLYSETDSNPGSKRSSSYADSDEYTIRGGGEEKGFFPFTPVEFSLLLTGFIVALLCGTPVCILRTLSPSLSLTHSLSLSSLSLLTTNI